MVNEINSHLKKKKLFSLQSWVALLKLKFFLETKQNFFFVRR